MAFEKIVFAMKTWKDKVSGNTPITAAELNRIEKGISDCAKQTNALGDSVSLLSHGMSRDSGTVSIAFSSANRAVALVMMDCNGKGKACLYFVSGISKLAILLAGNDNEPSWSDNGATITLNSTDWNNVTVISAGEPTISFA